MVNLGVTIEDQQEIRTQKFGIIPNKVVGVPWMTYEVLMFYIEKTITTQFKEDPYMNAKKRTKLIHIMVCVWSTQRTVVMTINLNKP